MALSARQRPLMTDVKVKICPTCGERLFGPEALHAIAAQQPRKRGWGGAGAQFTYDPYDSYSNRPALLGVVSPRAAGMIQHATLNSSGSSLREYFM